MATRRAVHIVFRFKGTPLVFLPWFHRLQVRVHFSAFSLLLSLFQCLGVTLAGQGDRGEEPPPHPRFFLVPYPFLHSIFNEKLSIWSTIGTFVPLPSPRLCSRSDHGSTLMLICIRGVYFWIVPSESVQESLKMGGPSLISLMWARNYVPILIFYKGFLVFYQFAYLGKPNYPFDWSYLAQHCLSPPPLFNTKPATNLISYLNRSNAIILDSPNHLNAFIKYIRIGLSLKLFY